MPSWWGWQTHNVLDRATSHLPALLYERLDELGIDFTILYPSMALGYFEDDRRASSRRRSARAVNRYHGRRLRALPRPVTVGALIPMNTPAQAIAEAEYAVGELGLKSVAHLRATPGAPVGGRRATASTTSASTASTTTTRSGRSAWSSAWRRSSHSALQYHRVTRSISSYVYNHIGGLAAAHESLCKSLFLGGVTRRFPDLRIGFLEGGVAWACSLFAGLVGHWEKRNRDADLAARSRPARRRRADAATSSATATTTCTARLDEHPRATSHGRRPARRSSTSSPPCEIDDGRRPARAVRARASTSGARPTIRWWRGRSATRSTRSAPGCGRSSAPTSRTGTCPT